MVVRGILLGVATERIWATTVGADDCGGSDLIIGPCDMCAEEIVGLHMHIEITSPNGLRRILGFCSEECAGRWSAGELVVAERIAT